MMPTKPTLLLSLLMTQGLAFGAEAPAAQTPEAEGSAPAAEASEAEGSAPAAEASEAEGSAAKSSAAEGSAPAAKASAAEGSAPAAKASEAEGSAPAAKGSAPVADASVSSSSDLRLDPRGISLKDAMEKSYAHSFNRQASEAEVEAARARRKKTVASMGPTLSVDGNRSWISADFNKLAGRTLPTGQRNPDEIALLGVSLNQPLTPLLGTRDRAQADEKREAAAKEDAEAKGQDARLEGASSYIRLLKALSFLNISRENLSLIEKQRRDAKVLQSQGKLASLDFSRFDLAYTDASTQVLDAEAQLDFAKTSFRETLGLPPDQPISLQDLPRTAEPGSETPVERPELRSATHRVEAASEQIEAARNDYLPQINAFARFTRDFAAEDIRANFFGLADINFPKEDFRDNFTYGFTMNWTLWDWGQRQQRDSELKAELRKVEAHKGELTSAIRVELSQAESEWKRAREALKSAEAAETLSGEIARAYELKFRNGLATTTDLLSVQRDRTRSQAQLANASYDLRWAALRLRKAQGLSF